MSPRPYALLAELTHRCPLHCPYCSNPVFGRGEPELCTAEWADAFEQAAEMGVVQVGLSGGEPLLRPDLNELVRAARAAGLYTNLITSGVGMTPDRAIALRDAGLDSTQLSFQADEAELADAIAGTRAHLLKIAAARAIQDAGLPLTTNVVLHRHNLSRLGRIVDWIGSLGATRVELANAQYYGWAWENRMHLLPNRNEVERANEDVSAARQRWSGKLEIIYVPADYFGERPKPCLYGWGQTHLTIAPDGAVLPCPTAWSIPGMHFENVRNSALSEIWQRSQSFESFRGTAWLPEPCRDCPEKEKDFGGRRCQAALITGAAGATDPVCSKSPQRPLVDNIIASAAERSSALHDLIPRQNPRRAAGHSAPKIS